MSKKYVAERIEEIKSMVSTTLPNAINKGIDVNKYLTRCRVPLNLTVIQAVFGAEFKEDEKKGGYKVKFKHKPASQEELLEISRLLNHYIETVEKPALGFDDYDEDDMSIPAAVPATTIGLPKLEKYSSKNIREYIFDRHDAISKTMLNGMDVFELATVSKKIRKHKNLKIAFVIGGIALVATGGVAAATIISKKNDNDVIDIDLEDIDTTVNLDEVADDTGLDDAPTVDLD